MITFSSSLIRPPFLRIGLSGASITHYFTLYSVPRPFELEARPGAVAKPSDRARMGGRLGAARVRRGASGTVLLLPPAGDSAAQLEVGDRPGERRQPERDRPVGEDRQHREFKVHVEGREGTDHAALDAAQAPGQRQQVA